MQAAWTAAACGRSKTLPKLDSLLSIKPAKRKKPTWQAMLEVATAWAAAAGEVRTEEDAP